MMAGSLSDLSIQIEKGPILIKYRAFIISGAGNQIRTGDLNLGKVALYQLSYARFHKEPDQNRDPDANSIV